MKDLLIVIPSRLKAKRLYRKPLRIIKGKTLIEHVYNNIKKINIYKIIVATDSLEIINLCKIKNIPCMMTKKTHQSQKLCNLTFSWRCSKIIFFVLSLFYGFVF